MRVILAMFVVLMSLPLDIAAQCAMCKTTIVNNVSNGELALAEGLNFGIMYLFASPYLVVGCIAAVLLYKYRRHAQKSR